METKTTYNILRHNSNDLVLLDSEKNDKKYLYSYMGIPNARQRLSDGVIQQKINEVWVDIIINCNL